MNDYDYLIKQFNLLIGFLEVSDEAIYNQIKHHDRFNLGFTIQDLYENTYANFSNHISSSSLLIGFAHFEDFLTKCIVKILIATPERNEYKMTFKIVTEKGDSLVTHIAEEQAKRLTFSEKIKFIEKHIEGFNTELIQDLKLVNDIRNCLMHNNGLADDRLSSIYQRDDKIILTAAEVNRFGLKAREFAQILWQKI